MNQEKTPSVESIHPFDPAQFPEARSRGTASRDEIRSTTHRVVNPEDRASDRYSLQAPSSSGRTGVGLSLMPAEPASHWTCFRCDDSRQS